MRAMVALLLEGSPLLVLPAVSLVIFMAVFAAVVTRVVFTRKEAYERAARLPLESEDRHERT